LTSEDLLRCRRVLDEALAADKLDSAQYRTRIRAMVVAVDKGDLYALIRDLVPAAGEPGFTDEGHEVPTVFSSVPASPVPRPEDETTRAVRATGADASAGPAPIDSFPSFPDDDPYLDEDDPFPDENYFHLGDEDSLPGEEDPYPDEEDSFPGEEARHLDQDVPAPVTQSSPESLEVDDPVTRVVSVIQPGTPAGPVPGELVPVRQWSAEVSPREQAPASSELSPREQAPASTELSPREQAPASTELSPVGQRSAEMSPLEPPPGTALSPAEQDDDDSVNRVVVVMVPSASSPDEPGVIRSVWDELPSPESPLPEPELPEPELPEPEPAAPEPAEPEPAEPSPADRAPVEPEVEDDEPVTRISSPVGFDDSEAPTQVLDAVKGLSIFRDEATEQISEPPQPVLPYSMNQGFSSTPADPMVQATTAPSTEYAVPPMPPPVPEPSAEALASGWPGTLLAPHPEQLLAGSVLDNVRATGENPASPERATEALRRVGLEATELANGYATDTGDNGSALSGGQRQRVALARAVAADPEVLILVNPTSSVDTVTEHHIAQELHRVRAGRTTVVISDSPAFRAVADRVVEVES